MAIMKESKVIISDGRYHIHQGFSDSEVNSGEFLVKPNMTLSVAELLDRYTHGRPLPDNMVKPVQYGNLSQNGRKGFDLADVPELKRQLEADIAHNTAELERLNKLDADAKEKAKLKEIEELKAKLKETDDVNKTPQSLADSK